MPLQYRQFLAEGAAVPEGDSVLRRRLKLNPDDQEAKYNLSAALRMLQQQQQQQQKQKNQQNKDKNKQNKDQQNQQNSSNKISRQASSNNSSDRQDQQQQRQPSNSRTADVEGGCRTHP